MKAEPVKKSLGMGSSLRKSKNSNTALDCTGNIFFHLVSLSFAVPIVAVRYS